MFSIESRAWLGRGSFAAVRPAIVSFGRIVLIVLGSGLCRVCLWYVEHLLAWSGVNEVGWDRQDAVLRKIRVRLCDRAHLIMGYGELSGITDWPDDLPRLWMIRKLAAYYLATHVAGDLVLGTRFRCRQLVTWLRG